MSEHEIENINIDFRIKVEIILVVFSLSKPEK